MDAHTHRREGSKPRAYILAPGELTAPPDGESFCAGIHPWHISGYPDQKSILFKLFSHPQCIGIGETGLDRLYPHLALQVESLMWHWEKAEDFEKPLILHLVKSSSDILALLKKRKARVNWILHDFQGPPDVVKRILKLHPRCYFSFGPRGLTRSDSKHLWDQVPGDLRLIETDDSGLTIEAVLKMSEASPEEMSKNFHSAFSL
jgi:TatD DNase family protein